MNLILNRNFELPADNWYQLAPLGEFPHVGAGVTQVIDEAACNQMVSAFETVKNASGNFPGLLIDFDHFSLDAAKHSEAAGWITDLKFVPPSVDAVSSPRSPTSNSSHSTTHNSPGGLYANIRWSDVGEAAVVGGRYRFLSPVWARSDCEEVLDEADSRIISEGNRAQPGSIRPHPPRLRPVRLLNAAVTNDPNLKGILPLSNRNSEGPVDSGSLSRDPLTQKEKTMKPVIDALLNKLNLPADTGEADLIAAIENMATADESAALTNRAETAESSLADLQAAQLASDADAFLEDNADLIENRDEVRTQFIENRELTEAVFKNLKSPVPQTPTPTDSHTSHARPQPLHNRDSKVAATRNRDASTSESKAVKIRNRASEIMKAETIVYTDAFRRAEQELSE